MGAGCIGGGAGNNRFASDDGRKKNMTTRPKIALWSALVATSTVLLPAMASAQGAPAPAAQPFQLMEATIDGIHAAMRARQLTCTQLVQAYLDRIKAYDHAGPKLDAVQNVNPKALEQAKALDAKFQATGSLATLHCIPVMLKDQVETDFMPTTYGSAIFKTFQPTRNATIVKRLLAADAIILAKNNMGEYAAGFLGSAFEVCRNPYDPTRNPSGSSCGTSSAVAANFGVVGIAEDTGGSIRGPAAHTSLVGLRPTLPLVSRFGMMPATPTRDTLGPITRTVRDTAIVLDVIAGYDPNDQVTAQSYGQVPPTYTSYLKPNGLEGMRFGIIREPFSDDSAAATDPNAPDYKEIQAAISKAAADLTARGAKVVDPVTIPRLNELLKKAGRGTYEAEGAIDSYLAQHPNAPVRTLKQIVDSPVVVERRREALGRSLGKTTNELPYFQEQQAGDMLRAIILAVMADNQLDALIHASYDHEPTVLPVPTPGSNRRLAPVLGFPALSVPGGFTSRGLPIGVELLGRPYSEGNLLKAAFDYEQATKHRRPPSTTPALK
jgi:amidase